MPDDVELLRQVRRGSDAAFRMLLERHGRYLYGIAHALVRNAADADDLVQETFVGALKTGFRGEASLRTWLVRILVRRAAMLYRSRRRRPAAESLGIGPDDDPTREVPTHPDSPGTEARLDLSTMLQGLSPEHRAVIVLRELEGLTYDEIAATLGIPRGTVESRLYRAREALRRRFRGYFE